MTPRISLSLSQYAGRCQMNLGYKGLGQFRRAHCTSPNNSIAQAGESPEWMTFTISIPEVRPRCQGTRHPRCKCYSGDMTTNTCSNVNLFCICYCSHNSTNECYSLWLFTAGRLVLQLSSVGDALNINKIKGANNFKTAPFHYQ